MDDKLPSQESDPIHFDESSTSVLFSGKGGCGILFSIMLAAKFSDPSRTEAVLNEPFARLLWKLRNALSGPPYAADSFSGVIDEEICRNFGKMILFHGDQIDWWRMDHQKREGYIKTVMASPYDISDSMVRIVFDVIEEHLISYRKVLKDADIE